MKMRITVTFILNLALSYSSSIIVREPLRPILCKKLPDLGTESAECYLYSFLVFYWSFSAISSTDMAWREVLEWSTGSFGGIYT